MAQFVEFIGNHLILSSMWLVTVGAIFYHQQRTGASSVGPQQAVMLINREEGIVLDIREKKEFEEGHIVDAINIPVAKLKQRLVELKKHKEKPVIVACKMGQHSPEAAKFLQEDGFTKVYRLSGGITEWKAQTLPLIQKEQKSEKQKGGKKKSGKNKEKKD